MTDTNANKLSEALNTYEILQSFRFYYSEDDQ